MGHWTAHPDAVRTYLYLFHRRDSVLFTCGEPTLQPALPSWIELARRLGYREVELITNGRKLEDATYAESLVAAGLTGITVSVHGPDAETHDGLTRTRAFHQTRAGLDHLLRLRAQGSLTVRTSSVITRLSVPRLADLVAFLYTRAPDVVNLNFVQPVGRALAAFDGLVPRMRDVAEQLRALPPPPTGVRELVVTGMPDCVLGTQAARPGRREVIYYWDGRDFRKLPPDRGQVKREACRDCVRFEVCDGVFEAYAERFGWEEFPPLRS